MLNWFRKKRDETPANPGSPTIEEPEGDATAIELLRLSKAKLPEELRSMVLRYHEEMEKTLRGYDVEITRSLHDTELHWAAVQGDALKVRELLREGAKVDPRDADARTPLHWAARRGHPFVVSGRPDHLEVVRLLIQGGADLNARCWPQSEEEGWTPLHDAAQCEDLEMIRLLLDSGADINAQTVNGFTALHEAAQSGNLQMARLLLERGAEVNLRHWIYSPLDRAENEGRVDVAEFLRAHGGLSTRLIPM